MLAKSAIAVLILASGLWAQRLDPVQWTLTSDAKTVPPGSIVPLKLTAKLETGWHLYSITTPKGGPIASSVKLGASPAVASYKLHQPKPKRKLDPNFGIDTETFADEAVFLISATLKPDVLSGPLKLEANVRYQCCDDRQCLPPRRKTAVLDLAIDRSAAAPAALNIPAGYSEIKETDAPVALPEIPSASPSSAKSSVPIAEDGLGWFALTAFGLGLASIFTPCVFPMIPITVSFFLNQRGGILQAVVFSLGIVVLFCSLGLGVTAAVGPFGVIQLSANPWVNAFIAAVFFVFALSLLGAFEITLPSGMLTKLDQASRRGGYLGTLLMGLTFSLTSFACVGPFVGPLLVASAQGGQGSQPLIGMASFSAGLASPFFFLAAFPSYLNKLPKSGGWLMRVKVVMGFVLLAVMFKYISNIDQVLQTGILTRERFLAAWFVMFALAGLYLLGLLRLEGIEPNAPLGIGRLLAASGLLMFAFSLLPGMFGAPLGELDAYVPAGKQIAGGSAQTGPMWMKDQLPEALAKGRAENRLILVNFTGYTCTNCHWMKANMFPKPEVASALSEMVLVELYTDGTDATSEANQKLEDEKFQTVSMPFFAIMDADQKVIAKFPSATRDTQEFLAFLRSAKS